MKTITAEMEDHIAEEVTTLTTCWKVTRTDGQVFGFTELDADITFGAQLYQADAGYQRSAISGATDLGADELEVDGFIDSEIITDADIRAGIWAGALVEVFMLNWRDLTMNKIPLRKGWLGPLALMEFSYQAQLMGLLKALSQNFIELYSPECRAKLGDTRCTVNVEALAQDGTVSTVANAHIFTPSGVAAASGYFSGGVLKWLTGSNADRYMDVKVWNGTTVELFLAMVDEVDPGDTFRIYPGCDKSVNTCKVKFDNVVNFRGEPFVPPADTAMAYPDAKTG